MEPCSLCYFRLHSDVETIQGEQSMDHAQIPQSPARAAPRQDPTTDGAAPADDRQLQRIGGHIGGRIRRRRTELGLTQEQLGLMLGVSYQQIQKYETAANRVSAERLYELARTFGVEVSYFFDGLQAEGSGGALPHGGHDRAAIELVRNFLALDNEAMRTAVSGLLKVLREQRDGSGDQAGTVS